MKRRSVKGLVTRAATAAAIIQATPHALGSRLSAPPVQGIRATSLKTQERTSVYEIFPVGSTFQDSQYTVYFGNFDSKTSLLSFEPVDRMKGSTPVAATCCIEEGWAMTSRRPIHPPIRSRRISIGTDVPLFTMVDTSRPTDETLASSPAARVAKLREALLPQGPDNAVANPEQHMIAFFSGPVATAAKPPSDGSLSPANPIPDAPPPTTNTGAMVMIRSDPIRKRDTVVVLYVPSGGSIEFFGSRADEKPVNDPNFKRTLRSMQYAVFDTAAERWMVEPSPVLTAQEMRSTSDTTRYVYDLLVWVQGETGIACFAAPQ